MKCEECDWWDEGCNLPKWEECENRPKEHSSCAQCFFIEHCKQKDTITQK